MKEWRGTDEHWRAFGRTDPYYAVGADERCRKEVLDAAALEKLFALGERQVEFVLDFARKVVAPDFRPERVLDFGCGVGRFLVPMAKRADSVVGIDISPEMIAEARRNCDARGLKADFVLSDDELSGVNGSFNLIHSWVVFQHINPARGIALTHRLLEHLAPGGIAALHYTFRRELSFSRSVLMTIREYVPGAHNIYNLLKGRPLNRPKMDIFLYDLNDVLGVFTQHGLRNSAITFSNHNGHIGAFVFAQANCHWPKHPTAWSSRNSRHVKQS